MLRKTALVLGVLLTVAGLAAIGMYVAGVVEIIVDRPPDASWLFWGLGIAGIGATLLAGGVGLLLLFRYLRRTEIQPPSE